jgi:ribosomal protein S14
MTANIKCDQCGRPATILRCTPLCKDDGPFADEQFKATASTVSCKIACTKCGQRLQLIESTAT